MTWTHIDNDEDNQVSQDDLIRFSHSCTGESFDAELVVERVQTGSLIVFEIEGPVEFSEELAGSDVNCVFDFERSGGNAESWSFNDTSCTESHDDGTTDRMSANSVEKEVVDFRDYPIAIDGNLESGSLGGSFSFQTTEEFSGVRGRFPKGGALKLDAVTSAVRVMPSSDPALVREHAEYQVDPNGSGQFGSKTTVRWRSLMGGGLVNMAPNRAHELTNVRILPDGPDTTAELNIAYEVSNPDNDELVTTIEWLRNGSRIDGYDDEYLASDQTTKDDVITVNLTVSDGIVTARGSASTTIVDAPVVVDVPSPPDSVMHGTRLAFRAVASDPDGDPVDELRFEIDHGPAGMTVDPVSGDVAWEARGPMFGRTMEVNWGISMIAGIAVGDVDGDAEIEIFLLADSEVHRLDTGLRLQGKFDVHRDATTILLEKSSGRRKNLVIYADAQIVVLDPKSGAEVWRSPNLIGDVSVSGVQFVEVNGSVRIAIGTEFGMYLTR